MRAVVTRVSEARVEIEGEVRGAIKRGYLVLLGVAPRDTEDTAKRLAEKIFHLRIFADEKGKMNLSLDQVDGEVLVVSQFTLFANLKSRRPGFTEAGEPALAAHLYEKFMAYLEELGARVKGGEFGADMQVYSVNDGPVTILFDTETMYG